MKLWKQPELTAYDAKVKYFVGAYVIKKIRFPYAPWQGLVPSPAALPAASPTSLSIGNFFKLCKTSWKPVTSNLVISNYLAFESHILYKTPRVPLLLGRYHSESRSPAVTFPPAFIIVPWRPMDTQLLRYPTFNGVKLSAVKLLLGSFLWNAAKPGIF